MTKHNPNKSAVAPDPALRDHEMTPARSRELSEFADDIASATPEPALMATKDRPRPNIKFAGRPTYDAGKRKILNDPAPIDRYSDGGVLVLLPPADWQKENRLFYHSDAAAIVRAFPHLYKLVNPK